MFLRDVIRVAAALLCLAVAGTAIAFIVRSFFLAWLICAFFFLYASAIAVSGKCVLVGSLIDSSWLALRTWEFSLVGALLLEAMVAFAYLVGIVLAPNPYAGTFLQAFVLELCFGCTAIVAWLRWTTASAASQRRKAASEQEVTRSAA